MQSELQKAADRVREIQAFLDEAQENKRKLEDEVRARQVDLVNAGTKLREVERTLADTKDLIAAQINKRHRELNEMHNLCYSAEGGDVLMNACKKEY